MSEFASCHMAAKRAVDAYISRNQIKDWCWDSQTRYDLEKTWHSRVGGRPREDFEASVEPLAEGRAVPLAEMRRMLNEVLDDADAYVRSGGTRTE